MEALAVLDDVGRDEARERLAEYRRQLDIEYDARDAAIAMGYRAIARGHRVISLSRTVEAGGWFDNGLPRIAIGQATEDEVAVSWSGDRLQFFHGDWLNSRGALVGAHTTIVPISNPPDVQHRWRAGGRTIMPLIPPRYRPKWRRLRHCHLLWEVESWRPVPPRDPALLRHIGGDLWAVLAEWDLTELERHVLARG
jgi:hypothetical protein